MQLKMLVRKYLHEVVVDEVADQQMKKLYSHDKLMNVQ
jgi:hypothetical protein